MQATVPTYAVIVAGGQGTRMGTAVPKQFLELEGRPVLTHTLLAFHRAIERIRLILVLPAAQMSYAQIVLSALEERIDLQLVAGGANRYESVRNGLAGIDEPGIVFVHDGVRPLAGEALIRRCYEGALAHGSAIPVVPVTDSIRRIAGEGSEPVDRECLRAVQTPQTFRTDILLQAFRQPYRPDFTDEASVCTAMGQTVHLVEGERSNIKITTPEDLLIAAAYLKGREA